MKMLSIYTTEKDMFGNGKEYRFKECNWKWDFMDQYVAIYNSSGTQCFPYANIVRVVSCEVEEETTNADNRM